MNQALPKGNGARVGKASHQEPPPADYSDEVTNEQRAKIEKLIEGLEIEKWTKESGPAW